MVPGIQEDVVQVAAWDAQIDERAVDEALAEIARETAEREGEEQGGERPDETPYEEVQDGAEALTGREHNEDARRQRHTHHSEIGLERRG